MKTTTGSTTGKAPVSRGPEPGPQLQGDEAPGTKSTHSNHGASASTLRATITLKEEGNRLFGEKNYSAAIPIYKAAFDLEGGCHSHLLIQIVNNLILAHQRNNELSKAVLYCNLLIPILSDLKKHAVDVPNALRHKSIFRLHAVAAQLDAEELESCLERAYDSHVFPGLFHETKLGFLRPSGVEVQCNSVEGLHVVAKQRFQPKNVITLYAGTRVMDGKQVKTKEFLPNINAHPYLHGCEPHFGFDVAGSNVPFSPEVAGALCNDGTLSCPEVAKTLEEVEQSPSEATVTDFTRCYEENQIRCNNAQFSRLVNFPDAKLCVVASKEIQVNNTITVAYGSAYWLTRSMYQSVAKGRFASARECQSVLIKCGVSPASTVVNARYLPDMQPMTNNESFHLVELLNNKLSSGEVDLENYITHLFAAGVNGFDSCRIDFERQNMSEIITKLDSIFEGKATILLRQAFASPEISMGKVKAMLAVLINQALPNELDFPAACILKLVNTGVVEIKYNKHEKYALTM